jgi:hypothetical protein
MIRRNLFASWLQPSSIDRECDPLVTIRDEFPIRAGKNAGSGGDKPADNDDNPDKVCRQKFV